MNINQIVARRRLLRTASGEAARLPTVAQAKEGLPTVAQAKEGLPTVAQAKEGRMVVIRARIVNLNAPPPHLRYRYELRRARPRGTTTIVNR